MSVGEKVALRELRLFQRYALCAKWFETGSVNWVQALNKQQQTTPATLCLRPKFGEPKLTRLPSCARYPERRSRPCAPLVSDHTACPDRSRYPPLLHIGFMPQRPHLPTSRPRPPLPMRRTPPRTGQHQRRRNLGTPSYQERRVSWSAASLTS